MNFNLFNQYVNTLLYDTENKKEIESIDSLKDGNSSYKVLLSLKVENESMKEVFNNSEKLLMGDVFLIDNVYHLFHLNNFKDRQVKYDGFCFYHIRPEYFNKYREANPINLYYFLKNSENVKNVEYKGNIYKDKSLFEKLDLNLEQPQFEKFLCSNMIFLLNIPKENDSRRKIIISKDYIYTEKDIPFMESFFKNEVTFGINHNSLDDVYLNDLLAMKKDLNDEHSDYFFVGLNDLGNLLLRNHLNNEIIIASDIFHLVNKTYKYLSKYDVDSIYYYNKEELKKYKEILFYTLSN